MNPKCFLSPKLSTEHCFTWKMMLWVMKKKLPIPTSAYNEQNKKENSRHYYLFGLWFVYWFISCSKSLYITIHSDYEENNAASDNDYVVKNSDRTLTCRAPRYTESDASEADRNKDILIIFWKSSLILFVKPTFTRQIFEFLIFNIDSIV